MIAENENTVSISRFNVFALCSPPCLGIADHDVTRHSAGISKTSLEALTGS